MLRVCEKQQRGVFQPYKVYPASNVLADRLVALNVSLVRCAGYTPTNNRCAFGVWHLGYDSAEHSTLIWPCGSSVVFLKLYKHMSNPSKRLAYVMNDIKAELIPGISSIKATRVCHERYQGGTNSRDKHPYIFRGVAFNFGLHRHNPIPPSLPFATMLNVYSAVSKGMRSLRCQRVYLRQRRLWNGCKFTHSSIEMLRGQSRGW